MKRMRNKPHVIDLVARREERRWLKWLAPQLTLVEQTSRMLEPFLQATKTTNALLQHPLLGLPTVDVVAGFNRKLETRLGLETFQQVNRVLDPFQQTAKMTNALLPHHFLGMPTVDILSEVNRKLTAVAESLQPSPKMLALMDYKAVLRSVAVLKPTVTTPHDDAPPAEEAPSSRSSRPQQDKSLGECFDDICQSDILCGELMEIIRNDCRRAEDFFVRGDYKMAIICMGNVVEGILKAAIGKSKDTFETLINKAVNIGMITTWFADHLHVLRRHRNGVHPQVVAEYHGEPDAVTAMISLYLTRACLEQIDSYCTQALCRVVTLRTTPLPKGLTHHDRH